MNSGIAVQILNFRTESSYDFVTLEGHTFYGDGSRLFRLHGITKVHAIIFNSAEVTLSMTSDQFVQYTGFQLKLQGLANGLGRSAYVHVVCTEPVTKKKLTTTICSDLHFILGLKVHLNFHCQMH